MSIETLKTRGFRPLRDREQQRNLKLFLARAIAAHRCHCLCFQSALKCQLLNLCDRKIPIFKPLLCRRRDLEKHSVGVKIATAAKQRFEQRDFTITEVQKLPFKVRFESKGSVSNAWSK